MFGCCLFIHSKAFMYAHDCFVSDIKEIAVILKATPERGIIEKRQLLVTTCTCRVEVKNYHVNNVINSRCCLVIKHSIQRISVLKTICTNKTGNRIGS